MVHQLPTDIHTQALPTSYLNLVKVPCRHLFPVPCPTSQGDPVGRPQFSSRKPVARAPRQESPSKVGCQRGGKATPLPPLPQPAASGIGLADPNVAAHIRLSCLHTCIYKITYTSPVVSSCLAVSRCLAASPSYCLDLPPTCFSWALT